MLNSLWESTVFQTVASGVLVFSLGQILAQFVLDPLRKYNEVVGRIDNRLKFYSNAYGHQIDLMIPTLPLEKIPDHLVEIRKDRQRVVEELRGCSCDFESSYKQIPLRAIFICLGILPGERDAGQAASRMIRLSNQVVASNPDPEVIAADDEAIRAALRIPMLSR